MRVADPWERLMLSSGQADNAIAFVLQEVVYNEVNK